MIHGTIWTCLQIFLVNHRNLALLQSLNEGIQSVVFYQYSKSLRTLIRELIMLCKVLKSWAQEFLILLWMNQKNQSRYLHVLEHGSRDSVMKGVMMRSCNYKNLLQHRDVQGSRRKLKSEIFHQMTVRRLVDVAFQGWRRKGKRGRLDTSVIVMMYKWRRRVHRSG